MPEQAVFVQRNGRATATLSVINDTVVLHADCDSLRQIVEYYENVVESFKGDYNSVETMRPATGTDWIMWFCLGVVAGVVAAILLRIKN
jgi:hypothetical protein